jgi:hypothetical protein
MQLKTHRRHAMKNFSIFLALAVASAAAANAAAAAGHLTKMHGLSFSTTAEFSAPAEAGLDALRIVFPKDAKAGGEKMSLTAVRFPAEAVGAGGMADAELLDYVKTAFLAASGPGRSCERTFLGRKVAGQAFEKTIPKPARAEMYIVPLKSGDKIVLGFAYAADFAAQAAQAIGEAAASLRE